MVKKTYTGTPGLWNLFTAKEPDKGLATEEDKKNYEALVATDKLLTVNNAGHVTIYSTASQKYIDEIKPIIDKNSRLKALLEKRKKRKKKN